MLQIKFIIIGILSLGLFGSGVAVGKWWFSPDIIEGYEKAHEAEAGLIEDNKVTEIIYVDRIVEVEKHIEVTKADDRECFTPVDLELFNGGYTTDP